MSLNNSLKALATGSNLSASVKSLPSCSSRTAHHLQNAAADTADWQDAREAEAATCWMSKGAAPTK